MKKSKKYKMGKADWMSVLRVLMYNVLGWLMVVLPTITEWPHTWQGWLIMFAPVYGPAVAIIMKWLETSTGGITTILKPEPKKDEPLSPLPEP